MKALLKMDPSERLTAAEALRHPYFEGLHEPTEDEQPVTETNSDPVENNTDSKQASPVEAWINKIWISFTHHSSLEYAEQAVTSSTQGLSNQQLDECAQRISWEIFGSEVIISHISENNLSLNHIARKNQSSASKK